MLPRKTHSLFPYIPYNPSDFNLQLARGKICIRSLLYRRCFLQTRKVVDLVRKAVALALIPEDDPRRDELKKFQENKEEIDMLAHKQVQRILWSGLGLAIM